MVSLLTVTVSYFQISMVRPAGNVPKVVSCVPMPIASLTTCWPPDFRAVDEHAGILHNRKLWGPKLRGRQTKVGGFIRIVAGDRDVKSEAYVSSLAAVDTAAIRAHEWTCCRLRTSSEVAQHCAPSGGASFGPGDVEVEPSLLGVRIE